MFSRSRPALLAAILTAVAAIAAACSAAVSTPPLPVSTGSDAQIIARPYRLGVGDKLKISVYGEPDLSGTFDVNASGAVPMPLIGDIPAKGRPIVEFRDAIARKLSEGYLKSPKVSVEILNFRPIYVHGEVRTGGEYPYRSGLRLRDAVAVAGGYTYRANENYIILTREGESQEYRVTMPTDVEVHPGDNIRVPERFF